MSHTAHIPSHRKPRRNASAWALRSGVAGGVLSTLAVTGASTASATAEKPATETVEMPTITASLAQEATRSTAATQQAALDFELKDQQQRTSEAAEKAAADAKEKAERKAKAEAERKAEAARKAAAEQAAEERASRSSERTTLGAASDAVSSAGSSATGSAATLVSFLKAQVGKAYVSGATGPSAYDCSGLTQAAFRTVGVDLPRVSGAQSTAGTSVSLDALQPGDLLYWGSAGSAYHVGVYIGDGKFIGAQNSSTGVVEQTLDWDPPTGAVRVL
ncbi:C40 family peptidase [Streptomyces lycii]|uniref:Glycoside hydrolase n=1 Tax=Streptomyces lycii TaxID=2654337 RepID=A0ABQ7FCG0_9ACTN|nr:C40 family peptidase [Streptomyces lycii]KAF4406262.1 glycoside hydrolase [Streptomyces lycii]